MNVRVALLDTETTGLFSSYDKIIEIAVLLLEVDGESGQVLEILDQYQGLQDPGCSIPWAATAVHGITDAMVKGHRIDAGRVQDILAGADWLVAHNSGFDKGFVAQIVPGSIKMRWACSCRGIPWRTLFPGLQNARLQDLADTFQVAKGMAHRAMGDVETTLALLQLQHPVVPTTLLGFLVSKQGANCSKTSGGRYRGEKKLTGAVR